MEERISSRVEDYLDGRLRRGDDPLLDRLLDENEAMIAGFETQAAWIREAYRLPAELAPAPGFAHRVMTRIEGMQASQSVWSIFMQPFGRRLVYASTALLLLLGIVMYSTGEEDAADLTAAAVEDSARILEDDHPEVHLVGDQSEDRGRVFVNLAFIEQ
jgi:hypothetical protein